MNAADTYFQCTNVTFSNLTLEAQPHVVSVYTGGTQMYANSYEPGALLPASPYAYTGTSLVAQGAALGVASYNLLLDNCQFLYGQPAILLPFAVSNVLIEGCTFVGWGSTNIFTGAMGGSPNTTSYPLSLGVWGTAGGGIDNVVALGNSFNANTTLMPNSTNALGTVWTNNSEVDSGIGFLWFQSGGNFFAGRNAITNYMLEGIQCSAGPCGNHSEQ